MYVAWGWGGLHPNVYVAWGRVGPMPEGFIHPHTDGGAPHALALQGMGWRVVPHRYGSAGGVGQTMDPRRDPQRGTLQAG